MQEPTKTTVKLSKPSRSFKAIAAAMPAMLLGKGVSKENMHSVNGYVPCTYDDHARLVVGPFKFVHRVKWTMSFWLEQFCGDYIPAQRKLVKVEETSPIAPGSVFTDCFSRAPAPVKSQLYN